MNLVGTTPRIGGFAILTPEFKGGTCLHPMRVTIVWTCRLVAVTALLGCGGKSAATAGASDASSASSPDAASSDDANDDANEDAGPTADANGEGGAPASRNSACTPLSMQTGTAVNTSHGRLDGTLVYVLPVSGSNACNGDNSHVHLQIEVSGSVYDVAVDVGQTGDEVGFYLATMSVPGGTWQEGWHGADTLSYPSLGLKSTELPLASPDAVAAAIESNLAETSKISVFCTGYSQGNGCHDVHYENGNGKDGAIMLESDLRELTHVVLPVLGRHVLTRDLAWASAEGSAGRRSNCRSCA